LRDKGERGLLKYACAINVLDNGKIVIITTPNSRLALLAEQTKCHLPMVLIQSQNTSEDSLWDLLRVHFSRALQKLERGEERVVLDGTWK
jgi:hypothetical protein